MKFYELALIIFLLNIPFGYLRQFQKKFSPKWFLYIHFPVPIIISIRIFTHTPFSLKQLPFFAISYFLGQFMGAKINIFLKRKILEKQIK